MAPSQPAFLLRSDDDRIKPVAIFTDGFEFHYHPNNRLADDMQRRGARPGLEAFVQAQAATHAPPGSRRSGGWQLP